MRARLQVLGTLLCLAALAPRGAAATVYTAQVRWSPSPSAGVAGYHVYTRPSTGTYGTPLDAGLPAPAADGSLAFDVANLDTLTDYDFAVAAYAGDGTESGLSNEMLLSYSQVECAQLNCDDGDPCTADTCSGGVCQHTAIAGCQRCATQADCNDGNACTVDTCVAGVCQHAAATDGTLCDDGLFCTINDHCQGGVCVGGGPNCTQLATDCASATCDEASKDCIVTPVPNGTRCGSDANVCVAMHTCQSGTCTLGGPLDCNDHNACTTDRCDAQLGQCVHTAQPGCCMTDADCNDGNACTVDTCVAGQCQSAPVTCPDPGPCAQAACDATAGCVTTPLPDGTSCTASDPCIQNAVCTAGTCATPPTGSALRAADAALVDTSTLTVTRFTLKRMGRQLRLIAQGRYPWSGLLDVTGGVSVELHDASAGLLYDATVPSAEFRGGPSQLVYAAAGSAAPHDGLRRLELRARRNTVTVNLRASVPPSLTGSLPDVAGTNPAALAAPARSGSGLAWVLRFGTQCVSDPGLTCSKARGGTRQCH
ncbi:MAG TPA: fibronectin type III domain-containing protein [Candidatus Binatia bacterium]|nr:fibronectin type III domain-containing protein [Candidatus Binatia bacterium]